MEVAEQLVDVGVELRVTTHASVWIIRPDAYLRLPRSEAPRPLPGSAALVDGEWHHHVGVWKMTDSRGVRYRILPAGRPPSATGIYTGDVIAVGGPDAEAVR